MCILSASRSWLRYISDTECHSGTSFTNATDTALLQVVLVAVEGIYTFMDYRYHIIDCVCDPFFFYCISECVSLISLLIPFHYLSFSSLVRWPLRWTCTSWLTLSLPRFFIVLPVLLFVIIFPLQHCSDQFSLHSPLCLSASCSQLASTSWRLFSADLPGFQISVSY